MANFTETIGGVDFTMVHVAGGEFPMGDTFDDGYGDERHVHEVALDGYYLAQTPVTQALWLAVMGNNPSHFKNGGEYPVEMVSWNDVQEFIGAINSKTGKKYCLPTEAQWEYAARERGKNVRFGNGQDTVRPAQVNFDAQMDFARYYSQGGQYRGQTTPVTIFVPNALGLHDMCGNVSEWCGDWYGRDYYLNSPVKNPPGPISGAVMSIRGGHWGDRPRYVRAAYRNFDLPDKRSGTLGFRLAHPW